MSNIKNTHKLINEAIDNIQTDRACASKLLTDVMIIMASNNDSDTHKKLGEVASKYLETLQRSNEQLVKIATMTSKINNLKESLSKDDINSIYDDVNSNRD